MDKSAVAGRGSADPTLAESDAALLPRLQRADPKAFAILYAAEKTRLYTFLLRLCRNRATAADLFQNTWLKLARSLNTLRDQTNLRAWLFTVARNEYMSHCRAQRLDLSRIFLFGSDPPEVALPETCDSDTAQLELALSCLSEADREVLLLIGVEQFEPQEAAKILGISGDALRQRLKRARDRLAAQLARLEREIVPCSP